MRTFTYATPTFISGMDSLVTLAAYNDCYSELMSYTALAYTYWVSFHNVYQCQGHTH